MNDQPILPNEPLDETPQNMEPNEKQPQKRDVATSFFEILEMFAWSMVAVLLLFTFCIRLCRVDGSSMENTLYNGQMLLVSNVGYTPKQDDIIVFHLTKPHESPAKSMEKTMVKRIIATGGQKLVIDFESGIITVDGEVYEDSHRVLKTLSDREIGKYTLFANHHLEGSSFVATVPEGHLFVMGDNRNNSKDSRDYFVGFVDERCVLGRAICRIAPFDWLLD